MTKLAFVDTETTGLDPIHHEIWEVALILREPYEPEPGDEDQTPWVEYQRTWQLPVDLGRADPIALNIGQFQQRRRDLGGLTALDVFARDFANLTVGAHLVGAVVSFDEERLRRLLRKNHQCPMWHYHLVDVEAFAAGAVAGANNARGLTDGFDARPPWDSNKLSAAVGVDPGQFDRHTALGDAQWARAIYDAVMGQ